jgi:very-short-patch-repair endonuclease
MRSAAVPDTFLVLIDCYRPRLRPGQAFAGRTAVRLWGLPLPWGWIAAEPLDIAVPLHLNPPSLAGVRGRRLAAHKVRHWTVRGVDAVDAVAAVFSCASELTLLDAVVLIDALLTDADNYRELVGGRPFATRADLERRLAEWGRFPGSGTVRKALRLARERVESPKETETRLLIRAAGFAEPVVQHEVRDGGRLVARPDLSYPDLKIAIEYEGDGHRTDKAQWRRDIQRQRDLEDRGWIVIRLTQADLDEGGAGLFARLRGAIASRTR